MNDSFANDGVQGIRNNLIRSQQSQVNQRLAQYAIAQEAVDEAFNSWSDQDAWNPLALSRNFQNLEKRVREKNRADQAEKEEEVEAGEEIDAVEAVAKAEESAERFQKNNPELSAKTLLALRARLNSKDSAETALKKVQEAYGDLALADEALDFLLENSTGSLQKALKEAKDDINNRFGFEIRAGRNMGVKAREFSQEGFGTPTALRALYRNILLNPKDAYTLFQELCASYTYEKMKGILDFILRSLGADIRAKGPSMSRPELERFMTEGKNMQAILGVFRFFQSRMNLIFSSFQRQGLQLPAQNTFDFLAKLFMKFIQERYPSTDKALLLAQQMGVSKDKLAQLILYLQMRDATRQVAPRLFKDERQRQELLSCFIKVLEAIDDELEEEEEKKREQEEEGGEGK